MSLQRIRSDVHCLINSVHHLHSLLNYALQTAQSDRQAPPPCSGPQHWPLLSHPQTG